MVPIPSPKPTRNERMIDGLTHLPSGNSSYRPRGAQNSVIRFANYSTQEDDDAEREAAAIQRREALDNGGDRRRVRYGRC